MTLDKSFALAISSGFFLYFLCVNIDIRIPKSVVVPVRWVVFTKKLEILAVKPFCKPVAKSIKATRYSASSNVFANAQAIVKVKRPNSGQDARQTAG